MDKKKTPVPAGILLLAMMLVASLFLTLLPKLNLGPDPVEKLALTEVPPWVDVQIIEVDGSSRRGQRLEDAAERVRVRRWGPRTLDVDVVQVLADGAEILSDDPDLTLPHPHAHERAFVLVPWLTADPQARLRGRRVAALVEKLAAAEVEQVRPVGTLAGGPDSGADTR